MVACSCFATGFVVMHLRGPLNLIFIEVFALCFVLIMTVQGTTTTYYHIAAVFTPNNSDLIEEDH